MKIFGVQGFLNPTDSNDDGWFKFSLREARRNSDGYCGGFNAIFRISDCDRSIALDFDVDNYVQHGSKEAIARASELAKARRKKMKKLQKAVNDFAEAYYNELDKYEESLRR